MKPKRLLSGFLAVCCTFSAFASLKLPVAAADDWQEDSAPLRQNISIHNSTDTTFQDAPVLVELDASQISSQNAIRFYLEGEDQELPYEVESWNPAGTSTVWVQVPQLTANEDTTIYGYYNGDATQTQGQDVWNDTFALVEHFQDGDMGTDSTGKASGKVTGTLQTTQGTVGSGAVFTGAQEITYGPLLSGESAFTISAVIDSEDPAAWVGIAGRDKNGGVKDGDTYFLGVSGGSGQFIGRFYGTNNPKTTYEVNAPFSKGDHVLTLSYDGSKLELYLDGVLKGTKTAKGGQVLSDPATNLVLGAYSDGGLTNPFQGRYDEIQISSQATSADWEQFRAENYFGQAVTVNPVESKDGSITLSVRNPQADSTVETGSVQVEGYVSKASNLYYSLNGGEKILCGQVPAGNYQVSIPVYGLGQQQLVLTAESLLDATDTATAQVRFSTQDTVAPQEPTLSDNAQDGLLTYGDATLSATIEQADDESVSVQFYQQQNIQLTEENTVVRQGSTTAKLPLALKPDAGTVTQELYPETVGDNETPYQIYQITLTEEQQQAQNFHLEWTGSSSRQVGAYVYNTQKDQWILLDSGSGEEGFTLALDVKNENVLADGVLSILIWRGMNEPLSGRESYIPQVDEYDFNLMWTTDTQFYSQNTGDTELMTQQFQWIIDQFAPLKSLMVLHTGDMVNVSSDVAQWQRFDQAMTLFEEAKVPYALVSGNHDMQGSNNSQNTNFHTYFPTERLQANNAYWGGSYGDNYYYLFEEDGAEFIVLAMGMRWTQQDIEWASTVLQTYSDRFGILMVHDYLTVSGDVEMGSGYSDVAMLHDELVAKNENIRLVLCGHNHGANTNLEYFGDRAVYSILADYQSLSRGGLGYLRMLKFDVENDLIYVNTYSPYLDSTSYFTGLQGEKDGLYQKNIDEFVIETELGGYSQRVLTTTGLTLKADGASPIGQAQTVTGKGTATVTWSGLEPEQEYSWFVVVTDEAGNVTTSQTRTFQVGVNFQELQALLQEAESYTDLSAYPQDLADAFAEALKNAQNLGVDATQAQVDQAAAQLKAAMDALKAWSPAHNGVLVPAKEPTCTQSGNIAYWYCADCGGYFLDEACKQPTTLADVTRPAAGHQAVKVEAKEPTATESGNIAYWYCPVCASYFKDEALTQPIAKEDTILAPTGTQEPDPSTPETGDATAVTSAGTLLLLSAGAALLVARRRKENPFKG